MSELPALAIIGAGCIGRRVAQACAEGELPYALTGVCDIDSDAAARLIADYAPAARAQELGDAVGGAHVVIEAAAAGAVAPVVAAARASHQASGQPGHVLLMSVGGLLDVAELHAAGPVLHVPAGALGGLDAVQAMAIAGLEEVTLTTRKAPASLGLEGITEERVLFEGSAADVIRDYPKNVNVAIALSLAGLGVERTRVRLVVDPRATRNTHHVLARGAAGEVEFTSRNVPFPENPRTSYLAALSAIALLKKLAAQLQVG